MAYWTDRAERRNNEPAVQLPDGEKLAMSLAPNRTASGEGGSPLGPRIELSTSTRTPGNIASRSCGPSQASIDA
jgi:hypothetical protein